MQQLVYALNDIKRDFNVLLQKLSAVDRAIKTGDVSHLMQPIQGSTRKRNRKSKSQNVQNGQFGTQQNSFSPQVFGQQTRNASSLWGGSSGNTGGRRRNRKKNQINQFGSQQSFNGIPNQVVQQAHLTAQYLQQMLKNGQTSPIGT